MAFWLSKKVSRLNQNQGHAMAEWLVYYSVKRDRKAVARSLLKKGFNCLRLKVN
jgi:hypothetical protein